MMSSHNRDHKRTVVYGIKLSYLSNKFSGLSRSLMGGGIEATHLQASHLNS